MGVVVGMETKAKEYSCMVQHNNEICGRYSVVTMSLEVVMSE